MRVVKFLTGDTLIEVLLAITIFSFVAISSMVIINGNTNNLEANLELTMARAEVDSQAEAIRFIHDAFVSEGGYMVEENASNNARSPYLRLWQRLTNNPSNNSAPGLLSTSATPTAKMACQNYYANGPDSIYAQNRHAYVVNTRKLAEAVRQTDSSWFTTSNFNKIIVPATSPSDSNNKFGLATTYARVVYGKNNSDKSSDSLISDNSDTVQSAQGIWVITVPQDGNYSLSGTQQFYDFHIYTCWYGPGRDTPTTIGTILRLYNPRYKS